MNPTVIRSAGAALPPRPSAVAGAIAGTATAVAAIVFRKRRRVRRGAAGIGFLLGRGLLIGAPQSKSSGEGKSRITGPRRELHRQAGHDREIGGDLQVDDV